MQKCRSAYISLAGSQCQRLTPGQFGRILVAVKRAWVFWLSALAFVVLLIIVLHAVHVLPLPPAPPYTYGDATTVTPTNPWTW